MTDAEFAQPTGELDADAPARSRPAPRSATPVAVVGALLCVAAVALVGASAPGDAAFGRALVELLIVGMPIAAGLYALHTETNRTLAFALIGIGFAWSLTALGESSHSIPYTIGRLADWLVFPCVVYLILAFPDARIASRLDRALFGGVLALSLALFYGTAPLVLAYPAHTLWATCTTDCPANAVAVVKTQPGFLAEVVRVREWLVMLLWLGLFWSLVRRFRAASPLRKRTIGPLFATAAVLGVLHVSFHASRQLGAPAQAVVDLANAWTLAIVAVCAACLFGLAWRRMLLGRTLAELGSALAAANAPAQVRDALAGALGDPDVEVLFRNPHEDSWRGPDGRAQSWPRTLPASRSATRMSAGDGMGEAVIVHDVVLEDDRALLDGVGGIVLAAWRHQRLAADLSRALADIETSRRIVDEAASIERARLERDLHDGAQQRLIALRIRLGLAEERSRGNPAARLHAIRKIAVEVDQAIAELRSLAHGEHPSVLARQGLAAALQSLASRSALPVSVVAQGVGRHSLDVESAVYFTCAEALQNVLKHATGATGVWIRLEESGGGLRFEVADDGAGMTPAAGTGHGIGNMRHRMAAVGGSLAVESAPGRGTRVIGSVNAREAQEARR